MSSFPVGVAQMVALYMQCILYGIALVIVAYGMRVLLWSRDGHLKTRRQINWILVIATTLMFIIATLEMGFGLQHNLEAFIYYQGPGGADAVFAQISTWINVIRIADYNTQTSIGDAIMVYRCYVVYDRNWKYVLIPAVLWLSETAIGWVTVYYEATLRTSGTLNESRLKPTITGILAITLVVSTMATGMIVYRIMRIHTSVSREDVTRVGGGNRRLSHITHILVESGLMYTAAVFVLMCIYLANNNAQYPVSDVIVQLIPISFTLIIIRVDQGIAVETTTIQSTTLRMSTLQRPIALRVKSISSANISQVNDTRSDFSSTQNSTYKTGEIGGHGGEHEEWRDGQV